MTCCKFHTLPLRHPLSTPPARVITTPQSADCFPERGRMEDSLPVLFVCPNQHCTRGAFQQKQNKPSTSQSAAPHIPPPPPDAL